MLIGGGFVRHVRGVGGVRTDRKDGFAAVLELHIHSAVRRVHVVGSGVRDRQQNGVHRRRGRAFAVAAGVPSVEQQDVSPEERVASVRSGGGVLRLFVPRFGLLEGRVLHPTPRRLPTPFVVVRPSPVQPDQRSVDAHVFLAHDSLLQGNG